MTREDKIKLAISKGYSYNSESGKIIGPRGYELIRKSNEGYIQFKINLFKKQYSISGHQFAWYFVNKEIVGQIDHINGVRDDNRICNLRSITNQQNQWNRTTAKGYSFHKPLNKWRAKIVLNSKHIHLGYFDIEDDAHQAYLNAKEKYHIIKNPHKEG
jgi:hypothetical protein